MYITKVVLESVRAFNKLELDFTAKPPENDAASIRHRMRTVIIGENGTCKTTLLKCLSIGLADHKDASGLVAEPVGTLVAEGKGDATITIDLATKETPPDSIRITTKLRKEHGEDLLEDKEFSKPVTETMLVCGYGVGRSTDGVPLMRSYRIIDSVYSLFQYNTELIPPELTVRRLRDFLGSRLYEKTMSGIKKALGLSRRDRIELPKGGGVVVSGPKIGRKIPLAGWADGYRITFTWLLDLYAWAMRAKCITPSGGIEGIALIDELEQHLHPSMQTDLLNRVSKLFPDLQIIATTHSPIVALSAAPSEVVVLKRRGKAVNIVSEVPDFRGYSAEDMLVDSNLFDSKVYSPETSKKIESYRRLISISPDKRTKVQKDKLKSLAAELIEQEVFEDKESRIDEHLHRLIKKYKL